MSDCSQASGIITGISAVVVLFFSELLPFIPQLSGNGIVHALVLSLRTALPTRTAIPTTEESPIPPPVTATV
jgi:hypothetical protein